MNVLHINQSDLGGGAGIAAYRLHQGLVAARIQSKLLVGDQLTEHEDVAYIPRNRNLEKQMGRVTSRLGFNYIHHVNTFNLPQHSFYQAANVLNFHNLHSPSGYFSYLAIPKLTAQKPAVFTLHDMWSFTGHCAYSYDCDRWRTGCGKCPYPSTYPAVRQDSTHLEWRLKNWIYSRSNLAIVTPSRWLMEQVQQSMLSRFPVHYIPNGIDTEIYRPLDSQQCRSMLGIPVGKKVLMFGAESLKDARKGGDLLLKALQQLPISLKSETMLLALGKSGEAMSQAVGISTLNLGYVGSDQLKAIAYSAADLFVFPTRADNLPLMLQESMACGTPMVSFKIGGVSDLVRPGITGYLTEPENVEGLRDGIVQMLTEKNFREEMSRNCRAITLQEYTLERQAQQYIKLYQSITSCL